MVDRVFKAIDRNGNLSEFELISPGLAEQNEGERHYRIAYSKSLVEGIFPKEKLRDVMKEHGMWTHDDDIEIKKIVAKLAVLQTKLLRSEAEGKKDLCLNIAKEMAEARKKMLELFYIQQSVFVNSAEGIAELVRLESTMAACTIVKATGQRYWKDYTEYISERDFNEKSTVYANVTLTQGKIIDDVRVGLVSDYPENKYIKESVKDILDDGISKDVMKEIANRLDSINNSDNTNTNKTKQVTSKKARRERRKNISS